MILHWYISHSRLIPTINDELHELSIYPFLMYANNQLISVGYLDHFDMDFLYLTDTQNIIIDERHLLKQGGQDHE